MVQEKEVLEQCLTEAKRKLDQYREEDNQILVDTTEADINHILEELDKIYKKDAAA